MGLCFLGLCSGVKIFVLPFFRSAYLLLVIYRNAAARLELFIDNTLPGLEIVLSDNTALR